MELIEYRRNFHMNAGCILNWIKWQETTYFQLEVQKTYEFVSEQENKVADNFSIKKNYWLGDDFFKKNWNTSHAIVTKITRNRLAGNKSF